MPEKKNDAVGNETADKKQPISVNINVESKDVFRFIVKLLLIGIVLYVSLENIGHLWKVVLGIYSLFRPFLIGALIALVLNAPMNALAHFFSWAADKVKLKRKNDRAIEIIALVMTFLIALFFIYFIANMIIPQLIESVKTIFVKVQANLPEYLKLLDRIEEYGIDTTKVSEWLSAIDLNTIISKVTDNAVNILTTVMSGASSIISGTFTTVTAIVFGIYVLSSKKKLSAQLQMVAYAYLKKPFVDRSKEIFSMSAKAFSNFISGQCLDAILLGLMTFIAMTVFRFPYALAICTMITVTAIVPYIGAFLGGAFGVLLIIIDSPLKALLFVVLFIVVQQIDNHLVYPRVVGNSVGLPAIWTFAAVIIGGGIWGIVGMLVFIPIFSVLYTLLRQNVYKRLREKNISAK